MKDHNSAIASSGVSVQLRGTLLAGLGILAFSFSFPATALALEGFGPWTTAGVRGSLAGILASLALLCSRSGLPQRSQWGGLAIVALGCGLGFPILSTLALTNSSTSHSAVVIGLLPIVTASISVLRTPNAPPRRFWSAAILGALVVLGFTLAQGQGAFAAGDLFLFGALLSCAAGYAEGGRLARDMPGWKVIAWGVVLSLPVNLVILARATTVEAVAADLFWAQLPAILGLGYVALISQFAGFVPWYAGMALIGVARASQLQLAQPLMTMGWAVLLLGERLDPLLLLVSVLVLGCIILTQRAGPAPAPPVHALPAPGPKAVAPAPR